MKESNNLHEENIQGYFGEKLDSAIKSLKGYLYTVIGVIVTILVVAIVACIVFGASDLNDSNIAAKFWSAGAVGIVGVFVIMGMFIAHFVYNIMGALRFGGLFNLLNSNKSLSEVANSSSQKVELIDTIKNTRNYMWGNLVVFLLAIVLGQVSILGFLGFICSIVLFVLIWKNKNKLVNYREGDSI